jgi:uncharacterized protein
LRVFLDTNVLVAAFATRGLCSDLLRLVLAEHQLIMTKVVAAELGRVLETKIGLPPGHRTQVTEFLAGYLVPETAASSASIAVRDVDDIEVVRSAIAAGADVLVTGDRDLLDAELDVPVVTPRGFWDLLRARRAEPTELHEP